MDPSVSDKVPRVTPRCTPKRTWRKRAACAAGVFALAACRRTDGPAPAPSSTSDHAVLLGMEDRVHPVGEVGQARDYTLRVESVEDCAARPPFAAKPGDVKVGVEVVIEGTSKSEVPVNPFYASLLDERGDRYSSTLAGCDPGLPSVRVVQGAAVRGFISFEVPKTARKLEMRYAPVVIGPGVEELRFAVER